MVAVASPRREPAPLLRLDALELARLVRRREVSARELVEAHIARIEEVNPHLNAIVWTCFDRARQEARAADERLLRRGRGELPPLLGVPFTVKEMIALQSCANSAGSWHRRHAIARRDATAVARLRDAGAIALGVTNQPEMGLWVESDSALYGRAHNPWDLARTPGGSSGGEGAIVGAGGSPFGVGSDAGGSIRLPSFYCGVAGHKPTAGLVPLTGHFPFVVDEEHPKHGVPPRPVVIGPMARSARDLMPLLRIMAGADGVDPYVDGAALGDPARVDFRGKKVLLLDDPRFRWSSRTDPQIAAAVRAAARVLELRGAIIQRWSHPLAYEALAIWRAIFTEGREHERAAETLAYGDRIGLGRELARWALGRPRHSAAALVLVASEQVLPRPRGTGRRLREAARAMRAELEAKLGPEGVMILPVHPRVAPRHATSFLRPFDWAPTALFSALEMPGTAVNAGLSREGLPLGVQIVARRGADHASIAAGIAIEEAIGGFALPDVGRRSSRRRPARV